MSTEQKHDLNITTTLIGVLVVIIAGVHAYGKELTWMHVAAIAAGLVFVVLFTPQWYSLVSAAERLVKAWRGKQD